MSNSYTLTDVIMTQSYGMKNSMPSSAENGRLLIARVNNGISEIWGGTGSGVELLSGAKVDLSNLNQTGEAKFNSRANVDLSNLSTTGQAKFNSKANADLSNLNANQTAKDTITTWGMPNYSKGISVSLPYTVTSSGFMFIQVTGYDSWHYATVNGKRIGASIGYSGGKTVGNGVVFPVSAGDVISNSNAGGAYFYPMKGADE